MTDKSTFEILNKVDVSDKVEQKMNLSYLSWAWAHAEMKKFDPEAEVKVHEFPDVNEIGKLAQVGLQPDPKNYTINYKKDEAGAYVKVSVTIKGQTETETLPVMDMKNQAVKNPDAMQVNKAIKRCFVKALALHGLGLYIYAGEDLPEQDNASKEQIEGLKELIREFTSRKGQPKDQVPKMEQWVLRQIKVSKFEDATEKAVLEMADNLDKEIERLRTEDDESTND